MFKAVSPKNACDWLKTNENAFHYNMRSITYFCWRYSSSTLRSFSMATVVWEVKERACWDFSAPTRLLEIEAIKSREVVQRHDIILPLLVDFLSVFYYYYYYFPDNFVSFDNQFEIAFYFYDSAEDNNKENIALAWSALHHYLTQPITSRCESG